MDILLGAIPLVAGVVIVVYAAACRQQVVHHDAQGGAETATEHAAVFVTRLPGRWPDVAVEPRPSGSRLLRALGKRPEIETGHPGFDRRFRVRAADPGAARSLLSPDLVEAHVRGQAPPWRLGGGHLLFMEKGRLAPKGVDPGAERLLWLAATLGYRP